MKALFKEIFSLLRIAAKGWWLKDPFRESAVIAYYSIFSLPVLLVVIISQTGNFFGAGFPHAYATMKPGKVIPLKINKKGLKLQQFQNS